MARHRTATRNAIFGIVHRKLLEPPVKKLFGAAGRKWLLAQQYTAIEKLMLDNALAHLDAINERIKTVDAKLTEIASLERDVKLLMTIPGVNVTVAIGLVSAIGDIVRFGSPDKLAAYFGLVPRVYQSAGSCYHGPITKQGRSVGRWLAVEAAQSMVVSAAPLTATYHRVRRRKSHNVAIVALARKLVVVVGTCSPIRSPTATHRPSARAPSCVESRPVSRPPRSVASRAPWRRSTPRWVCRSRDAQRRARKEQPPITDAPSPGIVRRAP